MQFLMLFLIVISAVNCVSARVAGWPTAPLPDETVNLTFTTGTADDFSIIIPSDDHLIQDDIVYTPSVMFIGKRSGEMLRCVNQRCLNFNTATSAITSLVVAGEYIFAGLASGVMWRCSLHTPNNCISFNSVNETINALTVTRGHIYAGVNSGKILQCELDRPDSCSDFIRTEHAVTSLGASDAILFAGLSSGSVLRCPKEVNDCVTLNVDKEPVTAIAVKGDYIYASTGAKVIKHCNTIATLYCSDWHTSVSNIKGLSIFNKTVYVATETGFLSSKLHTWNAFSEIGNMTGALSVANIYGTFQLQNRMRNENIKCTWQAYDYDAECPPFVEYYDLKQRLAFELIIRDGKVYNAEGILFDTTNAGVDGMSHSTNAAIFVMAPNGQIFAINDVSSEGVQFESSMLAGSPASAAGELVVEQGVIKKITTCSRHYRPSLQLNNQLIDSLYIKGYTTKFESILCPRKQW